MLSFAESRFISWLADDRVNTTGGGKTDNGDENTSRVCDSYQAVVADGVARRRE